MITIAEINTRNREFWRIENGEMDRRMADTAVLDTALEWMRAEMTWLPIHSQRSLHELLAVAERAKHRFAKPQSSFHDSAAFEERARKRFATELGRKGGKAKRKDALQMLIEEFVRLEPTLTEAELRNKLKENQSIGAVQDVDEEGIHFTNHNDRLKLAKWSSLKHRLSRAKKAIKSR